MNTFIDIGINLANKQFNDEHDEIINRAMEFFRNIKKSFTNNIKLFFYANLQNLFFLISLFASRLIDFSRLIPKPVPSLVSMLFLFRQLKFFREWE